MKTTAAIVTAKMAFFAAFFEMEILSLLMTSSRAVVSASSPNTARTLSERYLVEKKMMPAYRQTSPSMSCISRAVSLVKFSRFSARMKAMTAA